MGEVRHQSRGQDTLYSKKVPAKIASRKYAERVKRCVARNNYITRLALDVEKSRFSHSEWYNQIEVQCKEPTELLFFQGGHYEFTYNKEDCFSQSQLANLYDLPPVHDVNLFKRVKVLCAPPGIKDFTIDTDVI